MAIYYQDPSTASNECDFLVLHHFKSAYLRFYWRYLNNFCIVTDLISSTLIWWKNLIFEKMRHAPHFDRALSTSQFSVDYIEVPIVDAVLKSSITRNLWSSRICMKQERERC